MSRRLSSNSSNNNQAQRHNVLGNKRQLCVLLKTDKMPLPTMVAAGLDLGAVMDNMFTQQLHIPRVALGMDTH